MPFLTARRLIYRRLARFRLRGFANKGSYSQSVSSSSSTHDYVICGAGSAGCVLANRLSADPSNSVLLLEAGPTDSWVLPVQVPAGILLLMQSDKYNWYYNTAPQKNLNSKNLFCPRGRVLGGTSSINGMVYNRGHAYDYDRWEREGAKGWSYADCLPYFKRAQKHELGANEYRGDSGPLHVTRGKLENPLHHVFLEAGQQAGYPITEDTNGYQQEGVGPYDMTIYKGKRWSTSNAYLKPVQRQRKERLTTETKALVQRILFEGSTAIGVEYHQNEQVKRALASKEVIICGGTINSPQLLMLSGIGDGDELKKLGIPVVCHLPGVGQNLQDHMQLCVRHICTKPISVYSDWQRLFMLSGGIRWLLTSGGVASTLHLEAGAFIRSHEDVDQPNIQITFVPALRLDHGREQTTQHGFQMYVGSLRSQSKGTIKLKSTNPSDHPIIDFNYMSTEEDWEEMRACLRIARGIFQRNAFDEFRGKELSPGSEIQSDKQVDEFIRETAQTIYHPTSTCKMGDSSDKMAVVDKEARVFGVEGLRVVDASIMPSVISGNTNAPTIMIAEKAADHILGNPLLPKQYVDVYKTPNKGQR